MGPNTTFLAIVFFVFWSTKRFPPIFFVLCVCFADLAEACAPKQENVAIVATQTLGGGVFSGKYLFERNEWDRVSVKVFFLQFLLSERAPRPQQVLHVFSRRCNVCLALAPAPAPARSPPRPRAIHAYDCTGLPRSCAFTTSTTSQPHPHSPFGASRTPHPTRHPYHVIYHFLILSDYHLINIRRKRGAA